MEGQDSEQASVPPDLVQLSWARGTGFPLGRHFTASERQAGGRYYDNTHTHTCSNCRYAVHTYIDTDRRTHKHTYSSPQSSQRYKDVSWRHTNTVLLVPVEFLPRWTHTLIASLHVDAAMLTAPVVDAALVNI